MNAWIPGGGAKYSCKRKSVLWARERTQGLQGAATQRMSHRAQVTIALSFFVLLYSSSSNVSDIREMTHTSITSVKVFFPVKLHCTYLTLLYKATSSYFRYSPWNYCLRGKISCSAAFLSWMNNPHSWHRNWRPSAPKSRSYVTVCSKDQELP